MNVHYTATALPDVPYAPLRIRLDLPTITPRLGNSFLFGVLLSNVEEWRYTEIHCVSSACCYVDMNNITKLSDVGIGALCVTSMDKTTKLRLVYQTRIDTKGEYISTRLVTV